jgi:hypothetical protein
MASMHLQHDQGGGPWILLHVVSGPWTSFVAALDKGQCRKAVGRRHTLLVPEGPGFSGGNQLTEWQPPRVSALAACSVAATRSVPVSTAEPTSYVHYPT